MPTSTNSLTTKAQKVRSRRTRLQAGALQSAIFNSANFSSIATDAKGVIQIFNVGAERGGHAGRRPLQLPGREWRCAKPGDIRCEGGNCLAVEQLFAS